MDLQVATQIVQANGKGKYRVQTPTGLEVRRLAIASTGQVMEMAKGRQRWGNILRVNEVLPWTSVAPVPKSNVPEEQRWFKAWHKVLKRLEASGFWRDIQEDIKIGLEIGLPKIRQLNTIRHDSDFKAEQAKVDPRLVGRSFIEYQMSGLPKVKTMRFSNYKPSNENYRQRLAQAVADKVATRIDSRADYDVSLEFRPAGHTYPKGHICEDSKPVPYHRGWYSEEFKGCGNGHYYYAIDAIHALFIEDD